MSWFKIALPCVLAGWFVAAASAQAQDYPARPVKIISDSAPGSAPDVILRIVADRLTQSWGQQVLALNHPGAGGSIAARLAAASAPDGYTLYMPVSSAFVTLPGAAPNLPLEVPRDFAPIGLVGEQPMFLTVAPSTGIKTLAELIAADPRRHPDAAGGRFQQAPARIPGPADGGRNGSRIHRRRLDRPGGAGRHAGNRRSQGERGFAQGAG